MRVSRERVGEAESSLQDVVAGDEPRRRERSFSAAAGNHRLPKSYSSQLLALYPALIMGC